MKGAGRADVIGSRACEVSLGAMCKRAPAAVLAFASQLATAHAAFVVRRVSAPIRAARPMWVSAETRAPPTMNVKGARYFAGRAPEERDESDSDVNSRPVRGRPDVARSADGAAPSRRRRIVARVVSEHVRSDAGARASVGTFHPIAKRGGGDGAVGQRERMHEVTEGASDGVRDKSGAVASLADSSSGSSSESHSESSQSEGEQNEQPDAYDEPFPSGFRPQFVKPMVKNTLEEQQVRAESEEKRFRRRRDEARQLVTDVLNEEDRQFDNHDKQLELPDDTDYEHERDVEFALWRVRELRRIKRDREAQNAWEQRTTKTAERKQQSEQTKPAIEQQQSAPSNGASKSSFLQRSYKLGPFFMEKDENGRFVEDIYNRDYSQPTEGENYDRTLLPKPLQVRHGQLGRSGRSKFTHLAAEDTAKDFIKEVKRDPRLEKALNDQKPNR